MWFLFISYDIRAGKMIQGRSFFFVFFLFEDLNKMFVLEYTEHLGPVNTITFIDSNRRFVSTSDVSYKSFVEVLMRFLFFSG